jgi:hypothetical protein
MASWGPELGFSSAKINELHLNRARRGHALTHEQQIRDAAESASM